MKTSNKLLLGLLILVILGVIVINFVYKHKLETKTKSKVEVVDVQNDSINNVQDSMAMEKAINNQ
ncbi:MAG: hypothetical protein WCG08_12665 [Paludibacter sp.]|jgi:hypothetical protein